MNDRVNTQGGRSIVVAFPSYVYDRSEPLVMELVRVIYRVTVRGSMVTLQLRHYVNRSSRVSAPGATVVG